MPFDVIQKLGIPTCAYTVFIQYVKIYVTEVSVFYLKMFLG